MTTLALRAPRHPGTPAPRGREERSISSHLNPDYSGGTEERSRPQPRRADGTHETIDWDPTIGEVADKLAAIRDSVGGDEIFYYCGGGQGRHRAPRRRSSLCPQSCSYGTLAPRLLRVTFTLG